MDATWPLERESRGGSALGRKVSRRRALAGLGLGGALVAVGGLSACAREGRTSAGRADGDAGTGGAFLEPSVLASDGGALDVTLVAEASTVVFGEGSRWALTYNGGSPGPTLRIRPGDVLTVTLENHLDQATNLHTHGLHVSPEGDSDNVFVMVEPGGRRTYRYVIPEDHPSGTFWYHPHHHGTVAEQVFGGLAGAILVEGDLDRQSALADAVERVFVLSDPIIGATAGVLGASMMDTLMGREGDAVLVNGVANPTISATAGTLEHWRIINASPSRYYALGVTGSELHLVGTDGGRLAVPSQVDELLLVPGERAEVLVPISSAGTVTLRTRPVDRGGMGMMGNGGGMGGMGRTIGQDQAELVIATVVAAGADQAAPAVPAQLGASEDLADLRPDGERRLSLAMGGDMGMGGAAFTIDGRAFDPGRVDTSVRVGTVEDWVISNTSAMDHPFHLHVWPFQVLDDGSGRPVTGWKDTVNVPAGRTVRVRVRFSDYVGRSVYHCHILDHEDQGMMGVIEASPA